MNAFMPSGTWGGAMRCVCVCEIERCVVCERERGREGERERGRERESDD
jgi:hypothetical protein